MQDFQKDLRDRCWRSATKPLQADFGARAGSYALCPTRLLVRAPVHRQACTDAEAPVGEFCQSACAMLVALPELAATLDSLALFDPLPVRGLGSAVALTEATRRGRERQASRAAIIATCPDCF
jgi:hypothetical protein